MKIITLLENHSCDDALINKHGLSVYIETGDKKILVDVGPDDSFIKNAQKLNVDLSAVDYLVISHGHYDHGGGLSYFLNVNDRARVVMHRRTLKEYFAQQPSGDFRHIGLNYTAPIDERFILLEENYKLENNIDVIMDYDPTGFVPEGNQVLYERGADGELTGDKFKHEIALLIAENGKNVFITGCSHSGIGNMVRRVQRCRGDINIDYVIGGFHLFNPSAKSLEKKDRIDALIDELAPFASTVFYTGHCTGTSGYQYLKQHMKNEIHEIHSGTVIEI